MIEILSVLTLEELGGEKDNRKIPQGSEFRFWLKYTLVPKKKEKEAQEKELPLRTAKNLGMGHLGPGERLGKEETGSWEGASGGLRVGTRETLQVKSEASGSPRKSSKLHSQALELGRLYLSLKVHLHRDNDAYLAKNRKGHNHIWRTGRRGGREKAEPQSIIQGSEYIMLNIDIQTKQAYHLETQK